MRYGLAIDIGTTNIKMARVDMETGEVISDYQVKNSQRSYGGDVLSRIRYACQVDAKKLTKLVRQDICEGIKRLGTSEDEPVAVVGNTTMTALLCGDDVAGMLEFPFTPQRLVVSAPEGVNIAPAAGAFIGGDVVAGLYALPRETDSYLFIDLGTNGEMVLWARELSLAVSAAAGPAFEYMVDASGSMLLEVLCMAYETGVVDETGLLKEQWFDSGYLWKAQEDGREFLLTQQKIRDVQLAKAAIRTGVDFLMEKYKEITGTGVNPEQIYLAGGMGIVSEEACLRIGMLPECFLGKCRFLGNTALQGAIKLLREPEASEKMQKIARQIQVYNLAEWEEFNDRLD